MPNANKWLEENYPRNGVCQIDERFDFDGVIINNYGKKRNEIIVLSVSQQYLTGTLDLSDFIRLEELDCSHNNLIEIILPTSLKILDCSQNKITELILKDNNNLEKIYCFSNQLTNLILPIINKLEVINVADNYLTSFNYSSLNPATLIGLRLENNNLSITNISVFSHLIKLTRLVIGSNDDWIKSGQPGNQFYGSLESLQSCARLELLDIYNSKVEGGLEYLPLSLETVVPSDRITWELFLYGFNLAQWQVYHPDLMIKAGKGVVSINSNGFKLKKAVSTLLPLIRELQKKTGTLNYSKSFSYSSFLLRDFHPFAWENDSIAIDRNLLLSSKRTELPLRLYNLATDKVVTSGDKQDVDRYLTLSYCWGADWEWWYRPYGQSYQTRLTKLGRKALNKVFATWQLLKKDPNFDIDHIWIDNFCINQDDKREREQEIRKQRNYYSNATATLIAIDAEIGDKFNKEDEGNLIAQILTKIAQSPWFHRAWTFQEGILSRQTVFMFDDYLVDGRRLALFWGGMQGLGYNRTPSTFVTPLGWSYGVSENNFYSLTLGEVLSAICHRKQTVLIDSIYSILGLLPYGNQVTVYYKETNDYSKEDLEIKLLELIQQAYFHNSKEVIAYLGERNPNNWWLPMINADCSFQIAGVLNENERSHQYYLSQVKQVTKQGIQLIGHFTIIADRKIVEIDRFDKENNTKSNSTIQFILSKRNDLIIIGLVTEFYYLGTEEPKELFIDMLNYEVILEEEQPEKYYKLVYHPLINYSKDETIVQQSEIKPFLTLTELDLVNLNLTETLDLSELINLEWLECGSNKITELFLPLNNRLKVIEVSDCYLTAFNYSLLNSAALTCLNISDNNLPLTNISVFSHLVNLELLWIGNWNEDDNLGSYSERINNNIYNKFHGSLESWKNLTKLKSIEISNTDINVGVEFLPNSIETILYSTKERPACRLKLIEQQLTEWLERKELGETVQQLSITELLN